MIRIYRAILHFLLHTYSLALKSTHTIYYSNFVPTTSGIFKNSNKLIMENINDPQVKKAVGKTHLAKIVKEVK